MIKRRVLNNYLSYLIIFAVALTTVCPFLWIITLSFKTEREFVSDPFGLPSQWKFDAYIRILSDEDMLRFISNSVITTLSAISIVLVASILAGYSLARISFPGDKLLYLLFIMSDAIPVFVVLVPLYIMIQQMGLGGSRWSLILPYSA